MIGALIIVFREVIEAGLIIGIVLAATKGALGSRLWIAGGAMSGIAGACLVAAFMGVIGEAFGGFGQELFNAAILSAAVVMLAWHNIWMAGHGKAMADDLFSAGKNAAAGLTTPFALAAVVAAAVMREGAEVVLFLFGIAAGENGGVSAMVSGGLMGLGLGAAVSALTYFGLLRIPQRLLFTVTGWLITFLAAGMASQSVAFLQQGGFIEAMGQTLWNSSWILKDSSVAGRILHTLIGYDDHPTLAQAVAYVATLLAIAGLTRWARRHPAPPQAAFGPAE